jgi:hypothetical protein
MMLVNARNSDSQLGDYGDYHLRIPLFFETRRYHDCAESYISTKTIGTCPDGKPLVNLLILYPTEANNLSMMSFSARQAHRLYRTRCERADLLDQKPWTLIVLGSI